MKDLTASDLAAVARDLLDGTKYDLLQRLIVGKLFEPGLRQIANTLDDAPVANAPSPSTPLTAELDETDKLHDGFGYAVWHQLESYQRAPSVAPTTRAKAQQLRETFVPALAELSASYIDEAAQARARRKLLDAHTEALQSFPIADGGTVYDWVVARLDAGDRLDELVKARAEAMTGPGPTLALTRNRGIGLLYRLRAALVDERNHNPELPVDLEQRLFNYADLVQSLRSRGSKDPTPAPEAAEMPKPVAPSDGDPSAT